MLFSLIVPSVGRPDDLERLFRTLDRQSLTDFHVIVVDQSRSNSLDSVIERYASKLDITHVRSRQRGAARARNEGFSHARGAYVTWPDDDCFYDPDVLETAARILREHQDWQAILGVPVDENGSYYGRPPKPGVHRMSRFRSFYWGCEYTFFIRRSAFDALGGYDEELGPGAGTDLWAGEQTDLLLRASHAGIVAYFAPELRVHHPNLSDVVVDAAAKRKLYHYAFAMGQVARKNNLSALESTACVAMSFRAIVMACLRCNPNQIRIAIVRWQGLVSGLTKPYRSSAVV
ncbi:MAG: glycosyltransferase family A protein [Capsulimonadaceae bacterium]|nr:glycosyltransferase family A protein [Capsulimonadaceae bacterium]